VRRKGKSRLHSYRYRCADPAATYLNQDHASAFYLWNNDYKSEIIITGTLQNMEDNNVSTGTKVQVKTFHRWKFGQRTVPGSLVQSELFGLPVYVRFRATWTRKPRRIILRRYH